jgi:fructose-1,6-bisphosphatase/inositol monophosphatase family enzyme
VRAEVSRCDRLADAVFVTSERATFDDRQAGDAYLRLEAAARLTRTWGDAYGYLLVATGRAELMMDAILSVWDAAAVMPVVTEAGGTFTDWRGEQTIFASESIGTNGPILAEVLAITREFPRLNPN